MERYRLAVNASVDTQATFHPSLGRALVEYRSSISRASVEHRLSIDRVATDISPDASTDISTDITIEAPYKIHDPLSLYVAKYWLDYLLLLRIHEIKLHLVP